MGLNELNSSVMSKKVGPSEGFRACFPACLPATTQVQPFLALSLLPCHLSPNYYPQWGEEAYMVKLGLSPLVGHLRTHDDTSRVQRTPKSGRVCMRGVSW